MSSVCSELLCSVFLQKWDSDITPWMIYQTLFFHLTNEREVRSPSKRWDCINSHVQQLISSTIKVTAHGQPPAIVAEEPGAQRQHTTLVASKAPLIAQSTYYANPHRWVREHWENNPIQIVQRKELKKETNGYSFTFSAAGLETKQHHRLAWYLMGRADPSTSSKVTAHSLLWRKTKLWAVFWPFQITNNLKTIFNTFPFPLETKW